MSKLTVVSEEQALVAVRWLIYNALTVVSEEQALVAARWLIVILLVRSKPG